MPTLPTPCPPIVQAAPAPGLHGLVHPLHHLYRHVYRHVWHHLVHRSGHVTHAVRGGATNAGQLAPMMDGACHLGAKLVALAMLVGVPQLDVHQFTPTETPIPDHGNGVGPQSGGDAASYGFGRFSGATGPTREAGSVVMSGLSDPGEDPPAQADILRPYLLRRDTVGGPPPMIALVAKQSTGIALPEPSALVCLVNAITMLTLLRRRAPCRKPPAGA